MNSEANIQHSPPGDPRGRIVAAARVRFRRFGYGKTSMQDIATACRMSAANLYRFYENKLAIAGAVAIADQHELLAACDEAVRGAPPEPAAQLIAFFEASIESTRRRIRQSPLLFELGQRVAREDAAIRRNFLQAVEARIAAILREAGGRSGATADTLPAQARLILMATAPFVLPWMMQNEPFGDPRAQVGPLVRTLVAGLSGSGLERAAAVRLKFG